MGGEKEELQGCGCRDFSWYHTVVRKVAFNDTLVRMRILWLWGVSNQSCFSWDMEVLMLWFAYISDVNLNRDRDSMSWLKNLANDT